MKKNKTGEGEVVLDHVAIAVKSIDKAINLFEDLGLSFSKEREFIPLQKVLTAFAPLDKNAHLELLEASDEKSQIYDFIQKKGEGIHHICLKVEDVRKMGDELRSKGYRLIYEEPVVGAKNCLVNFVHPKTAHGVLIEISQHL